MYHLASLRLMYAYLAAVAAVVWVQAKTSMQVLVVAAERWRI